MNDRASLAQAYLFAEGGSLTLKKLSQLMNMSLEEVISALDELAGQLDGSGLCILRTDAEATLAVSARESETLKVQYERELGREIGEAGLEVLAIVLYRGPSTRANIDYIRGVNTSSTIRTLLSRGLLERASNPNDSREYLYRPTLELLAHLGAAEVRDAPEYGRISSELRAFEEQSEPFNTSTTQEYATGTDTDEAGNGGTSAFA